MNDLFSTVPKDIKEWAVIEFLTHKNENPVRIHQQLLAFYDEDTVDVSVGHCWVSKSKNSGRNLDLNDHL
jgi:hypothetical protein